MKPHIFKCIGEIYAEVAGPIRKKRPQGWGRGEGDLRERGYICIVMTDSQCCMAETNITL